MKAAIIEAFGSPEVIQIKELAKPTPKDNEILIKVHASTVTSGDVRVRSASFPKGFGLIARLMIGFNKPKDPGLGNELAGTVEAIGKDVTAFKIGDPVFGATGLNLGANAEYIALPEDGPVVKKPDNLSFAEAAAVPFGAITSLIFLRDMGKIKSGQKVLVIGASGALGTYAIQLAKIFGAEVTAVNSGKNTALVKSLGADYVIDYKKEDFKKSGQTYDIIFDTIGATTFKQSKVALKPKGIFLAAAAGIPDYLQMMWTSIKGGKKVVAGLAVQKKEDLFFLANLMEAGELKAVIDRQYPMDAIADAHAYVEKGHKKGNVVIEIVNRKV